MKKSFNLFFIVFVCLQHGCAKYENVNIKGSTNYSHHEKASMSTSLSAEYKFKIEKLSNKKISTFLSGTVNPDYDHFLNEFKLNTFTGILVEF